VKIHCSVLAEDAIKAAVTDWQRKRGGATRPAAATTPATTQPASAAGVLKPGL
jgi:hypothetical protein